MAKQLVTSFTVAYDDGHQDAAYTDLAADIQQWIDSAAAESKTIVVDSTSTSPVPAAAPQKFIGALVFYHFDA